MCRGSVALGVVDALKHLGGKASLWLELKKVFRQVSQGEIIRPL